MKRTDVWLLHFKGQHGPRRGMLDRHISASNFELAEKTGQKKCAEMGWLYLGIEPFILADEGLIDNPAGPSQGEPPQLDQPSSSEQRERMRNASAEKPSRAARGAAAVKSEAATSDDNAEL